MWVLVGDVGNWAVARLLDSAARGDRMPGWADEFGWLLIFLAGLVTVAAVVRWVWQWWGERGQPEPPEAEKPWWATKAQSGEPEPQRMRQPSPIAQRGGVYHGQPVEDVDATVGIDLGATAVIERVRPVGYRGGRRV
jgi:hypothetical protein